MKKNVMADSNQSAALDDLIRTYGHPPCNNCGWLIWLDDFRTGDTLCGSCGAVQDRISVVAPRYKDIFDSDGNRHVHVDRFESYQVGAVRVFDCPKVDPGVVSDLVKKSPPYKRTTYLNERLKQWQCQEPDICPEDWERIETLWLELKRRGPIEDSYVLTKDAIRTLLNVIDGDLTDAGERRRFVRKYLVSLASFSCS